MKSRTSCFDGRFSLHLLRRFWPLWLLWLAILLIVPLGLHDLADPSAGEPLIQFIC
jgi:hypothetical protein